MKKFLLKTICALIGVVLLITCMGVTALGDEADGAVPADAEVKTITGSFRTLGHFANWDFSYSDAYFSRPSDQFDLDLARLSFGMAVCSFRNGEHEDVQEDYLIEFFDNIGFADLESDTYRSKPETDSIAYGLASKKIGDFTVLAAATTGPSGPAI